jgi:hypothetical protein
MDMAIKKVHYVSDSNSYRPICGAAQGQKLRRRPMVTTDMGKVTCAACAKGMRGHEAFTRELAVRFGLAGHD